MYYNGRYSVCGRYVMCTARRHKRSVAVLDFIRFKDLARLELCAGPTVGGGWCAVII
jgi:hypothetical protein